MITIKELEEELLNVTGNIQLIVQKEMDYCFRDKTNVVSGVIAKIDVNEVENTDVAIVEFTFENGNIITEDLQLEDLEINKDEYLSEGIISMICYENSKEIIIQE